MIRYFSDGTWFDKGTECRLVDDCSTPHNSMGIFLGTRTCVDSAAEGGRAVGEQYLDEELCGFDEFEIIDDKDRKFFGKPMRDISLDYHPFKMDAAKFVQETKQALDGFLENMKSLGIADKPQFIESWFETFLAWNEVEQG
jgi:hypothetical protein